MHVITRRQFGALALGTVACALAGLTGCTDSGTAAGSSATTTSRSDGNTLRVGVRSDIVGFGYLNDRTGKYYGLEIDIAQEMADRMGKSNVEFTTVTPDDRKEMLLDGQIDCIIACYSIADSRKENFDFSPAYYDDQVIAVVQNSSMFDSIDDMKGMTFGTMSGANAAPLLTNKFAEMDFSKEIKQVVKDDNSHVIFDTWTLLQYPSYQELSDALEEGTVDAMVLDGAIAKTYMNYKRSILPGFVVAEQSFGVATQKGSDLSAPVSDAIQAMLDDGTIETLIDKWD
ncbi:transporter substrate-binding domain-containing protein [Collinsella ihumii]|uniref:transporter substrate-binding domain-containing protein n=1 Tax=Collinsella ihumii TaxID=1720204 RepID=UPI0008297782|nr:transporter substrate-binding domain-containing protein [Collinsella ihumii]